VRLGAEPSTGIMAMAGYSLVGHVVGLILLIFMPRIIPHPPPPPLILTANIVSLPESAPPAPPAPRESAVTAPSERADQAARAARKEREPEVIPPEPDKPKPPKPTPKPPPRKQPPPRPEPEKTEEKTPDEPAAATPAGPLAQGIGLGAPTQDAGSGIPSITSASFPYQYYRTTMVNLIRARWQRPLTPGLTDSLRCAISFLISKNGRVDGVAVSVPSGLPALDESAMRAVMHSNPLPPLPYQYMSPSVSAELIFELTPD
jgi:TonB family protein